MAKVSPAAELVARVGAPFAAVPFSPPLEDAFVPGRADVAEAVRAVLHRSV